MKKILSIILVLMLAFTTVLVTACGNNGDSAGGDSETTTSSDLDSSSSTRVRPSQFGSGEPTSDTGNDNPPTSSGGGTKPNPPTSSEFNYSDYDYQYQNSAVMPTDFSTNAGLLDSLIFYFVEDYPRPTLSGNFYPTLVDLENQYNQLSSIEKSSLNNAKILLEARQAYNNIAKRECEKLIDLLEDATIDNITEFGTQAQSIQKLIDNLGSDANNIPNKATYDQKIAKADTLLTNTFTQKVTELQSFEYSTAYKAKLDDAGTIYELMNASQKSRVAASYGQLSALNTKYADAAVAYSFVDTVNSLPAVDALKDTDQAIIKQLKKTYNKMTAGEKAEIPAATKSKYEAYVAKAQVLWPEHVLHTFADTKQGDEFFKFSEKFNGAKRPECPVVYEGLTVTDGLKLNGKKINFTTTKAGVLTVLANIRNKNTDACDIVLKFNGTEVQRHTLKHDATGENCEYVFACNQAGNYELSPEIQGEGGILYYLIFS